MSKIYTDTILLLGLSLAINNSDKEIVRIAKQQALLAPRRERFYFNAIIKSKNPRKTVREILGKIPQGLLDAMIVEEPTEPMPEDSNES